ncbi:VWA domain-containing protein [Nocardia sp. NPDC005978]|uniref:vWA domain-containing protein n=1 Tax=Nocardia sp. NPDC005978 TaxID=3156725 RepID=UPI0033ACEAB9
MSRWVVVVAVILAVLAGGPVGVGPASAEAASNPLMVVVDSSGSMAETDTGGTRLDSAKRALGAFVDRLPAGARVGLGAYGTGTGSGPDDQAAGCRDYRQLVAVGEGDADGLRSAIDGLQPRGYTPIGYALRQAAAALPAGGERGIVLVSDGEDTCAPPEPCAVAKELAGQGIGLRVHTIGFRASGVARDQLSCIANATGGTYADAEDGVALERVLPRTVAKALRSYQVRGIPVDGSAASAGAPVLTAGGYVDDIDSEARHYAVDVPDGWRVYFSATVILPAGNNLGVEMLSLAPTGPDGRPCTTSPIGEVIAGADKGAVATVTAAFPDAGTACKASGRFTFAVSRPHPDGYRDIPVLNRPLEIQVRLEPPTLDDSGPAVPANNRAGFVEQPGPSVSVVGGGSFADATALPGSGRYIDTLLAGERVFFKVALDWGQGVSYRLSAGPCSGVTGIEAQLDDSLRTKYRLTAQSATDGQTRVLDPLESPRVFYRNRDSGNAATKLWSMPGWYYLEVFVTGGTGHQRGTTTPVTLEVSVSGDRITTPRYARDVTADPEGSVTAGSAFIATNTGESGSSWVLTGTAIGAFVLIAATSGGWLIHRRSRRG